ncbi:MAG: redoxin domain-containing protein [Candidatus Latescibacteria bacterium]|nr:redoxin domain-containing protein [Candidatus Latescibacterota bacterium]
MPILWAVLVSLTVIFCATDSRAQRKSVPLVGQPAPEFSLTDINGKTVSLSDFKGKKNVLAVVQRGWVGYW